MDFNSEIEIGKLLLEGRQKHKTNHSFGMWVKEQGIDIRRNERLACMWAAEDLERFKDFAATRTNIRSLRGLHAAWKRSQKEDNTTACIYIYQLRDDITGEIVHKDLCKIGRTDGSLYHRMLQRSQDFYSAEVKYFVEVKDSKRVETTVHNILKGKGLHVKNITGNEWFKVSVEDAIALIEDVKQVK